MITPNLKTYIPSRAVWYIVFSRSVIFFLLGIFWKFFLVIAIIVALYLFFYYKYFFTFIVNDRGVTINSGILFHSSRSIGLERIQNVTSTRGPLQMMFGIAKIHLWTASPGQIQIREKTSASRADGELYLLSADATWFAEHYLSEKAIPTLNH